MTRCPASEYGTAASTAIAGAFVPLVPFTVTACGGRMCTISARAAGCHILLTGGRTWRGGDTPSTTATQVAAGLDSLVHTTSLCAGPPVSGSSGQAVTGSRSIPTTDPSCGSTIGTPSTMMASTAGGIAKPRGTSGQDGS